MKHRILMLASTFLWAAIYLLAGVARAQDRTPQGGQNASSAASAATQQTAQGTGAASDNGAEAAGQLTEVVVTAERRATSLQQTPIVVEAISGDQSLELHLNNITSLQTVVPSFQSNDQGGLFVTINIRGMGNSATAVNVESGVAMFRDGLLMPEPLGASYPLFDIADTEVLEGPQGTLVGASSTAGAVEVNSANPDFTELHGYFFGNVGSYSDNKWQTAMNFPLSDTFAVRIAVNSEQRGSFYKDIGATSQGYFINSSGQQQPLNVYIPGTSDSVVDPGHVNNREARVKLLWKPTDNFQALGEAEYSFMTTGGAAQEPNPLTYNNLFSGTSTSTGCQAVNAATNFSGASGTQLVCPSAGTVSHSTYYYPGETPFVLDYYGTNMLQDQYLWHYSAELRYTLPDGTVLRSLSGYVNQDLPEIINTSYGPQNTGQDYHVGAYDDHYYSEEINLISPTTGSYNWIAGAFWDYRSSPVYTNQLTVPSPYLPYADPTREAITQGPSVNRIGGLFGNINWLFTNTLQLQFGIRENWDANYSANVLPVSLPAGTVVTNPSGTGTYNINYTCTTAAPQVCTPTSYTVVSQNSSTGQYTDKVTTGKVDLSWTPTPGQNFYLFYARGYKPGGVNASSVDHAVFVPEIVNDYEAGWKGRLFDGHLLTQVGLYYDKYQNMQYSLYDTEAVNDTSTGTYIANLPPSTIYGFEASEQAQIGPLGINAGLGYVHSALGAVTTLPNYALPAGFGSPNALPQCLAGHTYAAGVQCFNYTPYFRSIGGEQNPYAPTITANIAVDYRFPVGSGVIDPRVTYSHTDKQYESIWQVPYNLMGARNLLSASIDWRAGQWTLQLYGTNLTNQLYIGGVGNGSGNIIYGAPRELGIQAKRDF